MTFQIIRAFGVVFLFKVCALSDFQVPNGLSPTISPNGKYIAFYIKNLMVTKLLIYSLDKKQVLYKDRFIKHLEPDIRWSSDSRCVSFKEINLDVDDSYIYVVDITKGKYLLKLKKSAINWFLN